MTLADDVNAKVDRLVADVGTAITLMGELKALVDALPANDTPQLQAISDKVDAITTSLEGALAADSPNPPKP